MRLCVPRPICLRNIDIRCFRLLSGIGGCESLRGHQFLAVMRWVTSFHTEKHPVQLFSRKFGYGDEAVESIPCHGKVSRCESGRTRHFMKYKCVRCNKERVSHGHDGRKYCSVQCHQWHIIERKMESGDCSFTHGIKSWCQHNLPQVCECGTGLLWNGKPLRLQVDHRDGNRRNNRRENLRMLCPNCHTQTDNWGVKNASPEGVDRMVKAGQTRVLERSILV